MEKHYYVYLLASGRNGTLYVGVTSNLIRHIHEHRTKAADGFSKRYDVDKLVWFEETQDVIAAISREKRIKKYSRAWKINLIEEANPQWRDLFEDITK